MKYLLPAQFMLDLSHWEGYNDLSLVYPRPDAFIFKATEGTKWTDDTYESNITQAIAMQKPCGGYHFFRFENDAEQQAMNFLNFTTRHGGLGNLPATLDAEWGDYRNRDTRKWIRSPKGKKLTDQWQTWIDIVEKATGKPVIIYTRGTYLDEYARDWLRRLTLTNPESHALWLARYTEHFNEMTYPDRMPKEWPVDMLLAWQVAEDLEIEGIRNNGVDLNKIYPLLFQYASGDYHSPVVVPTSPIGNPYNLPRHAEILARPSLTIRSGPGKSYTPTGRILNLTPSRPVVLVSSIREDGYDLWAQIGPTDWIAMRYQGNMYAQWR